MIPLVLPGLGLVTVALVAMGLAAAAGLRRVASLGSAALCGVGALLVVIGLAAGATPTALELPLGPPGAAMTFVFDGLSGFFLLLVLLSGGCIAIAGVSASLSLLLGAMALTLLAADGFSLIAGLLLIAVVPLFVRPTPEPDAALMASVAPKIVLYVLIRILFGLIAPMQSPWWGAALMVLGAGAAVLGALRANLADSLQSILGHSTVTNTGLILASLGVALAARAVDLASLAALALGAALLLAMAHALFKSLLMLGAAAVEASAGSRRLDRLGGLIHGMPVTTVCVLVGAAAMAGLPVTASFAAQWTLFQAVFGASRGGGLGLQLLVTGTVAVLALATALSATAAVRLVGVAFLGRPRSPRGAAAGEAPADLRYAMTGLAAATVLVGLFPGVVLALAAPALRALVGASMTGRAGVLTLAAQAGGAGYSAVAIGVLIAAAGAVAMAVLRAGADAGTRGVPAWECGNEPAPPWLPFGDPLTQYGGNSFAQPLRQVFEGIAPTLEVGGIARSATRLLQRAERFRLASTPRALGVVALAVVAALVLSVLAAQW